MIDIKSIYKTYWVYLEKINLHGQNNLKNNLIYYNYMKTSIETMFPVLEEVCENWHIEHRNNNIKTGIQFHVSHEINLESIT